MGGWLTVEALRQLRLMGKDTALSRMKVILAAPDIDVDVFRAQLQVIGPMASPMTILVSKDDRALAVSSFISGERERVGALDVDDPRVQEAAKRANIQVVDISGLSATDTFKHNRFSELSVYFPVLAKQDAAGSAPDLRKAGAFVFNAVGATIASPFSLAGKLVAGQ
jgi:esterase/lipase superfamily enzyme